MALIGDLARFFVPALNTFPKGTSHAIAQKITPAGQTASKFLANYVAPKAYASGPVPSTTTSVQGTSTNQTTSTTGGTTGGTSGGTSGGSTGYTMPDTSGLYQQPPQDSGIDFDALIAPALQALDEAVGPLQQSSAANVQGIQQQGATQAANTKASIGAQQATLNRTGEEQKAVGESAVNEQRRQFSQIQQGLQARYGGTTGTGAFATEIAGSQAMKNVGQIRQKVSGALQVIGEKIAQVQEIGRIALQDIEDNTSNQIAKEKANLEQALSQIRLQKGELQMRKAELAANAMQIYQNTVNQINAQNTAFKQNLFLQQKAAEQALQLKYQQGQKIASSVGVKNVSQVLNNPVGAPQQQVSGGTAYANTRLNLEEDDQSLLNPFEKPVAVQ